MIQYLLFKSENNQENNIVSHINILSKEIILIIIHKSKIVKSIFVVIKLILNLKKFH